MHGGDRSGCSLLQFHRLPREVVETPSLEMFKTRQQPLLHCWLETPPACFFFPLKWKVRLKGKSSKMDSVCLA